MARASLVPARWEEGDVLLELRRREAVVLRAVLACVGGPAVGDRGLVENVAEALDDVGVTLGVARAVHVSAGGGIVLP